MKIIFISFFIFISSQISAHECILQGTSAEEITIYNTCKADQKNQAPSKNLNNSLLKLKIKTQNIFETFDLILTPTKIII